MDLYYRLKQVNKNTFAIIGGGISGLAAIVKHADQKFSMFCGANKLQSEMLRIALQDSKHILKFIGAIKKFSSFSLPYKKTPKLFYILYYCSFLCTQLPFILFFSQWKRITPGAFALGFSNRTLMTLFLKIFPHHEHFSIFSLILKLGWMDINSGGYPVGGSSILINQHEKKYRAQGGTIQTLRKQQPEKYTSLKNLYMTGHMVWPAGGIPGVIRIARQTAQTICHNNRGIFSVRVN